MPLVACSHSFILVRDSVKYSTHTKMSNCIYKFESCYDCGLLFIPYCFTEKCVRCKLYFCSTCSVNNYPTIQSETSEECEEITSSLGAAYRATPTPLYANDALDCDPVFTPITDWLSQYQQIYQSNIGNSSCTINACSRCELPVSQVSREPFLKYDSLWRNNTEREVKVSRGDMIVQLARALTAKDEVIETLQSDFAKLKTEVRNNNRLCSENREELDELLDKFDGNLDDGNFDDELLKDNVTELRNEVGKIKDFAEENIEKLREEVTKCAALTEANGAKLKLLEESLQKLRDKKEERQQAEGQVALTKHNLDHANNARLTSDTERMINTMQVKLENFCKNLKIDKNLKKDEVKSEITVLEQPLSDGRWNNLGWGSNLQTIGSDESGSSRTLTELPPSSNTSNSDNMTEALGTLLELTSALNSAINNVSFY